MSGKFSRNQGSRFELEIATMIFNQLGVRVRRNLNQFLQSGDDDLTGLDGWSALPNACFLESTRIHRALLVAIFICNFLIAHNQAHAQTLDASLRNPKVLLQTECPLENSVNCGCQ
jgi:hypothetical protein